MDFAMRMESEYIEAQTNGMQETCFAKCVTYPGHQAELTDSEWATAHNAFNISHQLKCVEKCGAKYIHVFAVLAKDMGHLGSHKKK